MGLRDKLDEALAGDEIDLDFSQARAGFGPVPTGDYNVVVVEAKGDKSKAGVPKVVIKFEITDDDDRKAKGRTFFKHCPAAGDGSGILREALKALGVEEGPKLKTSTLVGKKAVVTVRFQKGCGEGDDFENDYQEIAKVKSAKAGSAKSRLS